MPSYGELLDQICFLKFILMMIVPFLVLLVWAEKKVPNSNKGEELVGTSSSEIEQLFEQDSEPMRHGDFRAYCACSFCGKLSHVTTTCSRCKAALYCSKACHVTHWRFWHKYECVESEADEGHEGSSPSHGTHFLLLGSKKYPMNQVEQEREEGEEPYIKAKEGEEEYTDGTAKSQLAIVSGYNRCAVCGNPSTKKCSRCKAIKYCSKTCQHFDWRSGHNFRCVVEKENSAQALTDHQEVHAHGNVVLPTNSYAVEDSVDSSGPLCLEFYSEGKANANEKALILRSQEATRESQEEIEELVRSLNEELEMIKKNNISLQSERDKWEKQARYAVDRLYSLRKENEHQMFVLKHENELISNAEDQARKMLHSLSQRLHNLQIEMEARATESKRKDEYIHILQNECVKAKTELQEQKKCVQRLTMELDEVTQLPIRIVEATRQKFDVNALSSISAAEFRTPYTTEVKLDHPQSKITKLDDKEFQTVKSLSRNPTYTRQACAVCLTNEKDMAFGCGHMTCRDCGSKIRKCHICRKKISNRIKLFTG